MVTMASYRLTLISEGHRSCSVGGHNHMVTMASYRLTLINI